MKIIVRENERGYLYKNGVFRKLLTPGKHRYSRLLGESVQLTRAIGVINDTSTPIEILMQDKNFAGSTLQFHIGDGEIGLLFVDGRISCTLLSGQYVFWNIYEKYTCRILDISTPEAAAELNPSWFKYIPSELYSKIEVSDGETSLLYYNGQFNKLLNSGIFYFWNKTVKVTHQLVDMRLQQLDITGQEILTSDKVALRINFVCNYRIVDPLRIVSTLSAYKTQIYILTQLALREYIGKFRFDEFLEQKNGISDFILAKLQEVQKDYYVEFTAAGVKDIILPGEVRDIMNTVLIAEKTAQANVIARREEVASTRSLLNTAKLMEENQTLYKLKELEYLERICDKVGHISLSGGSNLLNQINELLGARQ